MPARLLLLSAVGACCAALAGPAPAARAQTVPDGVPSARAGGDGEVQIVKSASRTTFRRGEVVTWTVEVVNGTTETLAGLLVQDSPAPSFTYVKGSGRWETLEGVREARDPESPRGPWAFGVTSDATLAGLTLAPGARARLTYQTVIGQDARPENRYTNGAAVRTTDGRVLTPVVRVSVRVEADAEFDEGMLLGRVYCDEDGDGVADSGEPGVGGVKVWGDHGWTVDTDREGKWHLKSFRPGNHMVKIDENSLPPGSELTTPVKRVVYVTPGFVGRVDFGVTCALETVEPKRVERAQQEGAAERVKLPRGPLDVVTVTGDLTKLELSVDGQALDPLAAKLVLKPPTNAAEPKVEGNVRNVIWTSGVLSDPLVFETGAVMPEGDGGSWRLAIHKEEADGGRSLVREFYGKGAPPATVSWNGTDATGVVGILERDALYQARLHVADGKGGAAVSSPSVIGVSYGSGDTALVRKTLRGSRLFGRGMKPSRTLARELRRLRSVFRQRPDARLLISVHTADTGLPEVDLGQTRRAAFQLGELAQRTLGVPAGRVLSIGYGAARPERPNLTERDREYNRRVELLVLPAENPATFKPPPTRNPRPMAAVQGLAASLDGTGLFTRTVGRPSSGKVSVHLRNEAGQERLAIVEVTPLAAAQAGEEADEPAAGAGKAEVGGDEPAEGTEGSGKPAEGAETHAEGAEEPVEGAEKPADTAEKPEEPDKPDKPPVGVSDGAQPRVEVEPAEMTEADKERAAEIARDPLRRFGGDALRRALGAKSVLLDPVGPDNQVTAGELKVKLPPRGLKIGTKRLFVAGETNPANTITINGKEVHVDGDGRFGQSVPLPHGKSDVVILSTDANGNKARIVWPVEVSSSEFFLLVLADGAFGHVGAKLAEREHQHEFTTGDIFLTGRGALVFKGRVSGTVLGKDLFVTAHVDSTKQNEFEAFYEQVIDPANDYAVFGDASQDEQVGRARGPLYLLVELDKSKLEIGNVKTDFEGVELFRYDRSFYGAKLDFDKAFAEGWDTRIKAFVTDDNQRVARGHDELRATGGSLYYTSRREIVAGSEKLAIVVRELETGLQIGRHELVRDRDYRIDYQDGRIHLKTPLPSTIDALFHIGGIQPFNTRELLDGHQVWLFADYESRDRTVGDAVAWGVHGSQRIAKYVEIGGGYLSEGRTVGEDYQLLGAHVKVDLNDTSHAYFEFAESLGVDGPSKMSTDGGLTFDAIDRSAGQDHGMAFRAGLASHIGDLAGIGKDLDLTIKGYYQLMEPGFHSLGNRSEQATEKFGGQAVYRPTRHDRIVVRGDGATVLIEDPEFVDDLRAYKRTRFAAQYEHREKDWRAGIEGTYGQHRDDVDGVVHDVGGVAVHGAYSVTDDFELSLTQEAIIGGDDDVLGPDFTSRMVTTLGATYRIDDDMGVFLGQSLRWNGDNATRLGFRTRMSEDSTLYLEERVTTDPETDRLVSATVFGAEQAIGDGGRAYGEYRMDGSMSGRANRAVMGIAKRFELAEGVNLSAAYERSQTFGEWEKVAARDVISAGLEILNSDVVKYGGRYELRWDRGDNVADGVDQVQAVLLNGLNLKIADGLTAQAILNYTLTQNLTTREVGREHLEATLGLAFRPVALDFMTMLLRYTRRSTRRRLAYDGLAGELNAKTREDRSTSDLLSFVGIFELPARLQISTKVAWRHQNERVSGLPEFDGDHVLWLARLGFHLIDNFDVAAEYRLLWALSSEEFEHGPVIEVSYAIAGYVRIGAGFAWTRFTDDLLDDLSRDNSGFYLRLSGLY